MKIPEYQACIIEELIFYIIFTSFTFHGPNIMSLSWRIFIDIQPVRTFAISKEINTMAMGAGKASFGMFRMVLIFDGRFWDKGPSLKASQTRGETFLLSP